MAAILLLVFVLLSTPAAPQSVTGQPTGAPGAEAAAFEAPAETDAPLARAHLPLRTKLVRAELVGLGGQIVTLAAYSVLPNDLTDWTPTFDRQYWRSIGTNLREAWTTPPAWDGDEPFYNWAAHPYAGSFYYNAIRSQGGTRLQAFLFASAESAIWEFVIEATLERPSAQDLIVTPTLGALLGELEHRATMRLRRNGFNLLERIVVTILNPSYVLNNGYK